MAERRTEAEPAAMTRHANNLSMRTCGAIVLCAWALHAHSGGVLVLNSDASVEQYAAVATAFTGAIRERTVTIDLKNVAAASEVERKVLAADPSSLYCIGSKAYLVAHKLYKNRTIVLSSAINWQRFPLGAKTYGIANELPTEMQLTMFRYFFPEVQRIGVVYSEINREWIKQARKDGAEMGIKVIGKRVKKSKHVRKAMQKLLPKVDAIWVIQDPVVLRDRTAIESVFRQCNAAHTPVFTYNTMFAQFGAVMMITPDIPTIGRQAAALLKDTSDTEERFQSPAGSAITLNAGKAREYGIKLNEEALDSVNNLIE
jgi:putative ABC transport system substrate-binding protein